MIPKSATVVEKEAFMSCSQLKQIYIPDSIVKIEENAFAYSGLETVSFEGGSIEIGNNAFFYSDPTIKRVLIPTLEG